MTTPDKPPSITMHLPPLDIATAAWLIDFCGKLQEVIWRTRGAELEAYWTATEPGQLIYGPLAKPRRRSRSQRR